MVAWFAFNGRNINAKQLITERLKRHVILFKNNTEQLASEKNEGLISDLDYQSLYNDQARDLIETAQRLETVATKTSSLNGFVWLGLISIPLLSFAMYYSTGAYPDYKISHSLNKLQQSESPEQYTHRLGNIKATIEKRLEQRSDSIEYRLLLAQFAMTKENFSEALSHYSVIAELLPEDAQAQAYYAQALYLAQGRIVNAQVAAALDKTLQLDPFQVTALGMVGIISFESGDFQGATDAWQKLLAVTEPSSQRGQMIQKGLAEAKQQLALQQAVSGEKEVAAEQQDLLIKQTANDSPGISIQLSIDNTLLQSLDQNYSLFVYAKAETGPLMPLAVKRLTVADLPLIVTLDDSTAMTPNFTLSKFDRVIVGARISKAGTAIAQEGDITIEIKGVNWRVNRHQIIEFKP